MQQLTAQTELKTAQPEEKSYEKKVFVLMTNKYYLTFQLNESHCYHLP